MTRITSQHSHRSPSTIPRDGPPTLDERPELGRTMLEHIQPEGVFRSGRLGFTQVVTARPGRTVFVSGQTACDARGRPVGGKDVAAQTSVALENLGLALAAAGAKPGDVTMIRLYIVGYTPAMAPDIGAKVS